MTEPKIICSSVASLLPSMPAFLHHTVTYLSDWSPVDDVDESVRLRTLIRWIIFSFLLLHRLHWLITLIKLTRPLLKAKLWLRRHRQLSHSWKLEKVAVYPEYRLPAVRSESVAPCAEWSSRHVSEFGDSCWRRKLPQLTYSLKSTFEFFIKNTK